MREIGTDWSENKDVVSAPVNFENTDFSSKIRDFKSENQNLESLLNNQKLQNKDLKNQLGEIEDQLCKLTNDPFSKEQIIGNQKNLSAELVCANEEFVKIELKLLKTKSKLFVENQPSRSEFSKQSLNFLKKERSANLTRKNISVLIEEINHWTNEAISRSFDSLNDLKLIKEELSQTRIEAENTNNELEFLKGDYLVLEHEFTQTNSENDNLQAKIEELKAENEDLMNECQSNPLANELAKKTGKLEQQIGEMKQENQVLEFKCVKFRRFLSDDRLHFYIESLAKTQQEIQVLEKRQLHLEVIESRGLHHSEFKPEQTIVSV